MGKKTKVGKARKDRFYHLAKESGFRSRSAFKLIQLNRKYQFLEKSRVLIDLCAAPGGWLQVAAKHMPVSSIIVGVDLVPIKPIGKVVCLQEDITTAKCRQSLARELQNWKADVVLNDGSPNVGAAWIQDAFSQAHLVLSGLRIACQFLAAGGWFITKVFRSKDYQSLMWVFQQLFKKVNATKPQASRLESAEIFVTCQGYLAPHKIDPKLFDPKDVFKEVESEDKQRVTLKSLEKPSKAAKGYEEGNMQLYKTASAADFVLSEDHLQLLSGVNQLLFDGHSKMFLKHSSTTEELLHCCQDIKVLGRRELKLLVSWRNKMKIFLEEVDPKEKEKGDEEGDHMTTASDDELAATDQKVEQLQKEEALEAKRRRRKKHKDKMKMREKIAKRLQSQQEGALGDEHDMELFQLQSIKNKNVLNSLEDNEGAGSMDDGGVSEGSEDVSDSDDDDSSVKDLSSGEDVPQEDKELLSDGENPLVVSLADDNKTARKTRAQVWFQKPLFEGLEDDSDAEAEIARTKTASKTNNKKATGKSSHGGITTDHMEPIDDDTSDSDTTAAGDDDASDPTSREVVSDEKGGSFEIVPVEKGTKRPRNLDPEGLALGALMKKSKKSREDLIESAYNRWTSNDDSLPDWFVQDEAKVCHKQLPVTKEMVREYKERLKEINARPIKKIAEAKARKKRQTLKRLEKIKKKAQGIVDASETLGSEQAQQLKSLYRKAKKSSSGGQSKEVQYVVAKRGVGKRVSRPAGVSGRFKVVDPRMKKDLRGSSGGNKMKKKSSRKQ